jgi:hypothetical protein
MPRWAARRGGFAAVAVVVAAALLSVVVLRASPAAAAEPVPSAGNLRQASDANAKNKDVKVLKDGRRWHKNGGFVYEAGDSIPVVANKVGPYANPSETYNYYRLAYCRPESMEKGQHQLGQLLMGDRKVNTPYDLKFREDVANRVLCEKELTQRDLTMFKEATARDFFFELFFDSLPIWGYVGEITEEDVLLHTSETHSYLYTHLHFDLGHHDGQVVQVNVTFGAPPNFFPERVELTEEVMQVVTFSYSATWHAVDMPWSQRLSHIHASATLPGTMEVHWLSIVNSFVLVVLLTVFLSIILVRVVKNDFTRLMSSGDDASDFMDNEVGWKQINGDVFRFPGHKMALASSVGVGLHLVVTILITTLFCLVQVVDATRRGAVLQCIICAYALCAGVGGYFSARLYRQVEGQQWAWNIVATALLVPGPLALLWCFLNTVAWVHGSTAALPFGTVMVLLTIYLLVAFPLTVIGGIAGRNTAGPFDAPCRTKDTRKEIPAVPWYRHVAVSVVLSGFLPFSAIYIELHYIFSSMWGHKVYTLFGILGLALVMLMLVSAFITVAFTYFQLVLEDYRWWWQSFAAGGSTGLFVLAYVVYFFYHRSDMHGFMQTSFYFGYMTFLAYVITLALGSLGFYAAMFFVRYIYTSIRID